MSRWSSKNEEKRTKEKKGKKLLKNVEKSYKTVKANYIKTNKMSLKIQYPAQNLSFPV